MAAKGLVAAPSPPARFPLPRFRQYRDDLDVCWTDCEECGPDVSIDEEGCCVSCGRDAWWYAKTPEAAEVKVRNMWKTVGREVEL